MTTVGAPLTPYKGLAPFEDAPRDALLFFGREREREIIVANLLASRLTVLYGPTGVGKTSLLRAGVAHHLRTLSDTSVAIVSAWAEDPTPAIDAAVSAADEHVYLILDQLEEYFLYHEPKGAFAQRLPELVTQPGLRVNVLLGIREDGLAKLDFFKNRIPNLFANYLRLDHLDRAAGRSAIVGPLERLSGLSPEEEPYGAEPELVETVLDQVATGRIEYGLAGRGVVSGRDEPARVEAPFLQLVLERLWQVEQESGSRTLRLETLNRLGGAETIVRRHLDRALEGLDEEQQALAASVFEHLVTPSGTKIAHDVGDLARYAHANEEQVRTVLGRLAADRIVRPVEGLISNGRYEIFHDVLASGVLAWQAGFEAERELQRERRRRRRAIAIAGGALLALAAVAAVALFALAQRERAEDESRHARAGELAAQSLVQLEADPQRSLDLALRAARLEPTAESEDALRSAIADARLRRVIDLGITPAAVAFDRRSGRLYVADELGDIKIANPLAGRLVRSANHGEPIVALDVDRDGRLLSAGGRMVRTWTAEGEPVHSLEVRRRISAAAWRRDGDGWPIVAAPRGELRIWGGPSQGISVPFRDRRALRLEVAPGGERFAAIVRYRGGREDAELRAVNGRLIRRLGRRGVAAVAFSPDASKLAVGSRDGSTTLWDTRDARLLATFDDEGGGITDVAFSPDGAFVATASADSGVRVWELDSGAREYFFIGHNNPVVDLAWSHDGTRLADASLDWTGRILDVGGIGRGRIAAGLVGHREAVRAISFSRDGHTITTVSDDGTARVWDGEVEEKLLPIASHPPGPTAAAFDSSSRYVASGGLDGARLTDRYGRRKRVTMTKAATSIVRFDPAGRTVLAAGTEGASLHGLDGERLADLRHRGVVTDAAFAPNGRFVATASGDGWARVFDRTGRLLAHLPHGDRVTRLAIGSDGAIATGAADGAVRIWRRPAPAILVAGHGGPISALAFSPDGSLLATASLDATVRVWDGRSGAARFDLGPHAHGVNDVRFSTDSRRIVTASIDKDVHIFNTATHELTHRLRGHFSAVNSAAFSRDGRWVVSTSAIAAALWPSSTGRILFYLRGHTASVRSAEFSRDGRRILTASDDGTVRVYECDICGRVPELMAVAEQRLAAARAR